MNILLLCPTYYTKPVKFNFPYAIIALGTYLNQYGYNTKLLDGSLYDEKEVNIKITELAEWADILGLSMMTLQTIPGVKNIRTAKEANPNLIVVAGGVHPTLMPEQTIEHTDIDYVIMNEGEEAFRELIECIKEKKPVDNIKNLVFIKDNKIIKNPIRPFLDINKLPSMDWALMEKTSLETIKKRRLGHLFTGKGCNYRCTFCFNLVTNNKYRGYTAEKIFEALIDIINKYNSKYIYFRDDNFLSDKKRALRLADLIIENNIEIEWTVSSRVDFFGKNAINEEDFAKLVKAGLRELKLGCESGSQEMLNKLKKGIKVEQIYYTAELIKLYNIKGVFSYMIGLPEETEEQYIQTLDSIDRVKKILGKSALILGPHAFFIYPTGELYNVCIELGYRPPKKLTDWDKISRNTITGLPEYYWKDSKNYNFIENIATIRALNDVSIKDIFLPPYKFKNIRNFLSLILIIIEKLRWKFRYFGFGLIEVRVVNFIKRKTYGTWFSSI